MQPFRLAASGRRRAPHLVATAFAAAPELVEDDVAQPPQEVLRDEAADAAESRRLQDEGNALAEAGSFPAAIARWERALKLTPRRADLHESIVRCTRQRHACLGNIDWAPATHGSTQAQVLLELGETWRALASAERACVCLCTSQPCSEQHQQAPRSLTLSGRTGT